MSKAMGLLPSWYWPEGVQRYVAAPPVAIDELAIGRWARRYGSDPALVADGQVTTFQELDNVATRVAVACRERCQTEEPRVAVAVQARRTSALLLLGIVRGGGVTLLLDPAQPRQDQAPALHLFQAQALVTDQPASAADRMDIDILSPEALIEADVAPRSLSRLDAGKPALALVEGGDIVYHSHMSALSGAMAFAAFMELAPPARLVVARPWGSWEALVGLLAPLQAGGAAVLAGSGDGQSVGEAIAQYDARALWIDTGSALGLLEDGPMVAAIRRHCAAVYVTVTGAFPKRLRRQLRRLLRVPVLTVYGYAATGAIAASHPSWYLDDAVGIPMTGVDPVPLDPETGGPVEPPWQLLAHAGIGVRTKALAVDIAATSNGRGFIDKGLFYTGDLGVMDGNGMLYLLR